MKLYDSKLEFRAIKTMCSSAHDVGRAKLLTMATDDHFHDTAAAACFSRIRSLARSNHAIPSWSDLITDPGLPESVRDELSARKVKSADDIGGIKAMFRQLNHYFKMRVAFDIAANMQRDLDAANEMDGETIDAMLRGAADRFVNAYAAAGDDSVTLLDHKGGADKMLKELMSNNRPETTPTGLSGFDDINKGLLRGSLFIIAATTGAGKSALAGQLALNMAMAGKKVCFVPLEMSKRDMLARMMANVTGLTVDKFLFKEMTANEKKRVKSKYAKYKMELETSGGHVRIYEPSEDVDMEGMLTLLGPYDDDVIFIDYIGLLAGVDGDDFWRQLGRAARFAKVWAKSNDKIVVLLAQLSDEGLIKIFAGHQGAC